MDAKDDSDDVRNIGGSCGSRGVSGSSGGQGGGSGVKSSSSGSSDSSGSSSTSGGSREWFPHSGCQTAAARGSVSLCCWSPTSIPAANSCMDTTKHLVQRRSNGSF